MLEYCYAANFVAFYYLFNSPQSAMLRRVRHFCRRWKHTRGTVRTYYGGTVLGLPIRV